MTTMTPVAFSESQQALIDARLDTIERMLIGRVRRTDRIAILREVESQIHELLGDRDPATVTSDEVINVLRRLDPPEAYLSNDLDDDERIVAVRPIGSTSSATKNGPMTNREGHIGGVAGICSLGLILTAPLIYLFASLTGSEELLLAGIVGAALVGIVAGICGLILSIRGRKQGILPIFGIVSASLALPIWIVTPVVLFAIA